MDIALPELGSKKKSPEAPFPITDEAPVFDIFLARHLTRAVEIATRLQMFDMIDGAIDADALAARAGIGKRATKIILRILAAAKLVSISNDAIALTPLAKDYFMSASPFFKGPWFLTIPPAEFEMLKSVHLQDNMPRPMTERWRRGKVVYANDQGGHMHALTFAAASAFAQHEIWLPTSKVLDAGGGAGTFGIALCKRHATLQYTVLDLPEMRSECAALGAQYGLQERIRFEGKNFFYPGWPGDFNRVLFSNILHDWTFQDCSKLLKNAYEALDADGLVVINEVLLGESDTPQLSPAVYAMGMLMTTEGDQMSFADLKDLLIGAGFSDVGIVAKFGYYALLVGRKSR